MNATTTPTTVTAHEGRILPSTSAVMSVVVRAAGQVRTRLDLTHAGTPEQQLGMALGAILLYVRSGITVRAIAEQWAEARCHAQALAPAVPLRRPMLVGPSSVAAMVRLGGLPELVAGLHRAQRGDPATPPVYLRIAMGPLVWEICDGTAYVGLLRAWRQAARLLGDLSTDADDEA